MQSMRRSRSVLVELMIAVLFLAIAACVLAQLFAAAWETGEESRHTQASLILARDALERFSAGEFLPDAWSQAVNGEEYDITAHVTSEPASAGRMDKCAVTVSYGETAYATLETTSYIMEVLQDEDV